MALTSRKKSLTERPDADGAMYGKAPFRVLENQGEVDMVRKGAPRKIRPIRVEEI